MKHTPGPWKHEVRIKRVTYGQPVKGSPDHHYISGPRPAVNSCEPIICNLGPMNGHTEANAKLIAAAPELLDALKKAKETIFTLHGASGWDIYDRCSPEMKIINGAIAKAERGT